MISKSLKAHKKLSKHFKQIITEKKEALRRKLLELYKLIKAFTERSVIVFKKLYDPKSLKAHQKLS